MPNLHLRLSRHDKSQASHRKQIVMIVQNVDPLNPVVRFVPERCAQDGWGPFDIDLSTVTGGKAEEVSIRVEIAQDNLTFMPDAGVTAGCEISQKYLSLVPSETGQGARQLEFVVAPLAPDGLELQYNLGLIAAGEHVNGKGERVRWNLPVIIDPKIRNLN